MEHRKQGTSEQKIRLLDPLKQTQAMERARCATPKKGDSLQLTPLNKGTIEYRTIGCWGS